MSGDVNDSCGFVADLRRQKDAQEACRHKRIDVALFGWKIRRRRFMRRYDRMVIGEFGAGVAG